MSPKKPAGFPEGRWEKLGEVGVDSASIGITDLLSGITNSHFRAGAIETRYAVPRSEWAGDWGTGIRFWAGFGDGAYDIWAWIINTGENGKVDERIAQVVITMIDEEDLQHWKSESQSEPAHCDLCDEPLVGGYLNLCAAHLAEFQTWQRVNKEHP